MPIRNTHRVGDYLMRDDESGIVYYASEMRQIWDGSWRHKKMFETRQPQEFVQARNDPRALRHIRPDELVAQPIPAAGCIGNTTIRRPTAPATHIFPFLDVLTTELDENLGTEGNFCILEES